MIMKGDKMKRCSINSRKVIVGRILDLIGLHSWKSCYLGSLFSLGHIDRYFWTTYCGCTNFLTYQVLPCEWLNVGWICLKGMLSPKLYTGLVGLLDG
jgi:hypothetical protein